MVFVSGVGRFDRPFPHYIYNRKDDTMTAQELKSCRQRSDRIKSLNESIERLRSTMESMTQVLSLAPAHGFGTDKLAEQMAALFELTERRTDEIIALEQSRDNVEAWLQTLPPHKAKVIRLRYVDALPWKQVARRAGYAESTCYEINSEILSILNP